MSLEDRIDRLTKKEKIEIVSFGSGGFLVLVALLVYIGGGQNLRPVGGALFVGGMMVAFLPYGLYVYFRDKRYREMEREFPAFLRNVSESLKSGMSLPQAFQQASKTDYGRIDEEVRRISHLLSWGIPFPEVMKRMSGRLEGSGLMQRSISIVLQAYESGGNIAETLDQIAANLSKIKEAESEKKSVLMQQIYIIYAIHFLFVGIMIALYILLKSFILQIGSSGGSTSGPFGFSEITNFCATGVGGPICTLCPIFGLPQPGEPICYYEGLFLLMLMVEGVFNGLVAGEVLESKISAGVKHSMLMAPLGFVIYVVVLNVL